MTNPFDALGIPRGSTKDSAQQAYRKLAMKFHPDRVVESEQASAEAQFKKIKEAWERIDQGWVEPNVAVKAPTSPARRSYAPAVDPADSWRSENWNGGAKPRRATRTTQAPRRAPRFVEAFEVKEPKKNLGQFVAHVSLAQAFEGFVVELDVDGKKQFNFPKGTPHNLAKDFDVDGGQITITAKIKLNVFEFQSVDTALREGTIVNSSPATVVRTGTLHTTIEVSTAALRSGRPLTFTDFLGEHFQIPIQARGSTNLIRIPGRGYVDWYPVHDHGGSERGDLLVKIIPVDRAHMNNLS